MIFTIISFLAGCIVGVVLNNLIHSSGKEDYLKKKMSKIQEEFEDYFDEADYNSHILCPTCGELMDLDKKVVVVEDGDVVELIYTCPYCSTQQWV